MKKIDHHSGDKRGCHVWILHMGSRCTKCSFSLWSPWLSLEVWLWRKLEALAPAYDLEPSRMITRISLRLLHKVVTILFLTALLWLKKSGDGWVAAFWRKPLLLGLNHHWVWNQAVSSEKLSVWALCFFHETNVVSTENISLSPPFKSQTHQRFQSRDAARGSVFSFPMLPSCSAVRWLPQTY